MAACAAAKLVRRSWPIKIFPISAIRKIIGLIIIIIIIIIIGLIVTSANNIVFFALAFYACLDIVHLLLTAYQLLTNVAMCDNKCQQILLLS